MGKLTSWVVILSCAACGGGGGAKPDARPIDSKPIDTPVETLGPAPALAMACTDAAADVYTLPTNLPAMDDTHRGDVFHCATTESLSAYKVNAQIAAYNTGYPVATPGKATSGFWTFRIAYRSERNTVANARAEGDMAAELLIPEKPVAGAPLIVFGHGSVGAASKCAPSHLDLSAAGPDVDYPPAILRLAGAGYTVIVPDYTGFSYSQVPGYFNAEDEAHAILDATRAAAKILPTPPDKVAFVGHSQGGHAVLAAQSYAASYGHAGTLVGVAALAAIWNSVDLFAAATTSTAALTIPTDNHAILYAMMYAYSAEELRVGAGHGVDVFQTAKQTAATDAMFGGDCYDATKMAALGSTPQDFFEQMYVDNVGTNCSLGGSCTDTLSMMWKPFWINDRPPIDPNGAPLLVITGGMDTFDSPPRAQCGRNRITTDIGTGTTAVTYCQNANAAHSDLVRTDDIDYALSWIASKAGIGSAPAACTATPTTTCTPFPQDY